jgi:hypothetical protein
MGVMTAFGLLVGHIDSGGPYLRTNLNKAGVVGFGWEVGWVGASAQLAKRTILSSRSSLPT